MLNEQKALERKVAGLEVSFLKIQLQDFLHFT